MDEAGDDDQLEELEKELEDWDATGAWGMAKVSLSENGISRFWGTLFLDKHKLVDIGRLMLNSMDNI